MLEFKLDHLNKVFYVITQSTELDKPTQNQKVTNSVPLHQKIIKLQTRQVSRSGNGIFQNQERFGMERLTGSTIKHEGS